MAAAPSEAAFILGWIFAFLCMILYNVFYGSVMSFSFLLLLFREN